MQFEKLLKTGIAAAGVAFSANLTFNTIGKMHEINSKQQLIRPTRDSIRETIINIKAMQGPINCPNDFKRLEKELRFCIEKLPITANCKETENGKECTSNDQLYQVHGTNKLQRHIIETGQSVKLGRILPEYDEKIEGQIFKLQHALPPEMPFSDDVKQGWFADVIEAQKSLRNIEKDLIQANGKTYELEFILQQEKETLQFQATITGTLAIGFGAFGIAALF